MSSNVSSLPANIIPILQKAFQCYRTLTSIDITEYEHGAAQLVFPVLPIPMLSKLCKLATQIFINEPNILELPLKNQDEPDKPDENKNPGIIIVGDLHGHILDLLRILKTLGYPPKSSYLFLGDIVDRGDFSTETAVLILLMKVLWPKNIYIIRGNHEFPDMWDKSGFTFELNTIYNNNTLSSINNKIPFGENKSLKAAELFAKVFSYIPLAALLYDKILCVHGGIGPHFLNYKELNEVERPLTCYDFEPVGSVLWSDPSETIDTFTPSTRGSGFMYGTKGLHDFLQSQNLSVLIRGHQCAEAGVEFNLDNQVVTVFSASFYCGRKQNKSGVLIVREPSDKMDFEYEIVTFSALRYIQRCEASFLFSSSENSLIFSSRAVKLNLPQTPLPNPISPISSHPLTTTPEKSTTNAKPNPKSKGKNQNNSIETSIANSGTATKALPHLPNAKPISNADLNSVSSAPIKHGPCIPSPSPRIKEKAHSKYRSNSLTSKDFQQQQFNNLNTRSKLLASDSNDLYSNEALSNLNPNLTFSSSLISKASSNQVPYLRKNPVYEPSHLFPSALEPNVTEPRRKGKSSQQMTQKPQVQKQQTIGTRSNPSLKKAAISNSANNFYEQTSKNPSSMATVVNPRKKDTSRGSFKNVYRKSIPI